VYAESYLAEDEALAAARQRGIEVGAVPIGAAGGATLRFLAAAITARHAVEIGTGCGVSGVWLIRGMAPDGVLTSVDVEPEHQRLAKQAFAEAGIAPARARLIAGRALDVLPRLTDAAYDLVFCDGEKTEYVDYLAEAIRLLRPGGVVAFDNALARNRVGDSAARDEYTVAIRELARVVRDEPRLVPAMLPVGDGLLVAVRLADGS
jgi:predicted O-methyltransferase YrrM